MGLTILTDPVLHGTAAAPELQGADTKHRAIMVSNYAGFAWIYDPSQTAEQLLPQAMKAAGLTDSEATQVYSLAVASTEPRVMVARPVRPAPEVRPTAVAGAFYPASAQDIRQALDEMFTSAKQTPPEPWAAAMVPHAGWPYSGRLAAEVLSRVKIPDRVIIFCPKHRPNGADWAVAPHARWDFPGGGLASDTDLIRRLADSITGLKIDSLAHQQEHAIEVELPLLARLAPNTRVVGITIGGGDWPMLQQFAIQLAAIMKDLREQPLMLVSSDMNHFADEASTRKLDRLALDAIESLDPSRLYEVVEQNRISMCGMRPAVIVMETLRQLDALHRCEVVGYTTSAAASGDSARVVGYAGVLFGS